MNGHPGTWGAPGAFCSRWRYPLLLLWMLPWLIVGQFHSYPHGDWAWVEMGARILAHHHAPLSSGASLHVYADNSVLQMGPPALLVAVPLMWLSPQVAGHLGADVMSLLVLPALWCAERAASTLHGGPRLRVRTLFAGLVVVPIWALEAQTWGHVDDVIALLATLVALHLGSTGRHEVIAGLVLGTGVAAKPWAAIMLPLLLAYARPQIARSILAFVVGALAWWVPFVVADPSTVHALGSLSLSMIHHPTWQLVGLTGSAPSWIRPIQLGVGVVLSTLLVRRVGWYVVPVIVLAWRVTSDPYNWPYYVLGPLIGAAVWDLARPARSRLADLPWATMATVVAEFLVPLEMPAAAAVVRLLWFLGLTLAVLLVATSSPVRTRPLWGVRRLLARVPWQPAAAPAPSATRLVH